jgi:hypothetical protein
MRDLNSTAARRRSGTSMRICGLQVRAEASMRSGSGYKATAWMGPHGAQGGDLLDRHLAGRRVAAWTGPRGAPSCGLDGDSDLEARGVEKRLAASGDWEVKGA